MYSDNFMVVMEPLSRNWSYPDCSDLNEIFLQYINECSVAYLESLSTRVHLSRVGYDRFSLRYNWCKLGVISGSKHFLCGTSVVLDTSNRVYCILLLMDAWYSCSAYYTYTYLALYVYTCVY